MRWHRRDHALGIAMREQLFHLPPGREASLQSQLRERVVQVILDGHIPPGAALPSCRRLARQLGVARNTVVLAYQQLVDEGYLLSRERSGYYVNEDILAGRIPAQEAKATPDPVPAPRWDPRLRIRPSGQRNIVKPADWQRFPFPFVYGQFDPDLFPVAEWRECTRQANSVVAIRGWASDSIDRDDPELIEQIHTRLLPRRGVWAAPEEILVTVGAQHALYLLATLLMDRKTVVGVEDPGYPDARNLFSLACGEVRPLAVDESGLVLSPDLEHCHYVYLTPSHQAPTTVTMPMARREALLARARERDQILIEDDYESELNYLGEPTPALKSLDRDARVIYVGSLSKTLAPGLRLGYMAGPRELIREARALRRLMVRHPPVNNQRAVALFLSLGHHDSLVRRLSHAYRERWQEMGDALATHLPESFRVPTFGGTAYWVEGPPRLDAQLLARRAAEEGVLIEPGDVYFHGTEPPRHCFRLGFSSIHLERIGPGIRRLAGLVHEMV